MIINQQVSRISSTNNHQDEEQSEELMTGCDDMRSLKTYEPIIQKKKSYINQTEEDNKNEIMFQKQPLVDASDLNES